MKRKKFKSFKDNYGNEINLARYITWSNPITKKVFKKYSDNFACPHCGATLANTTLMFESLTIQKCNNCACIYIHWDKL